VGGAVPPGPGWWQASDGNWYPPSQPPGYAAPTGYQPPYGYGYAPPAPQRTNGLAIASMVLGILWLYWIGSILALIFGYIAKGQIDRSNGVEGGRGMAIAGIVLGWIGIAIIAIAIVVALAVGSSDNSFGLGAVVQGGIG
jgi:hypothetical protein